MLVTGLYEPGGRGFDSCRARLIFKDLAAKTKSSCLLWVPCGASYPRHARFPTVLVPLFDYFEALPRFAATGLSESDSSGSHPDLPTSAPRTTTTLCQPF